MKGGASFWIILYIPEDLSDNQHEKRVQPGLNSGESIKQRQQTLHELRQEGFIISGRISNQTAGNSGKTIKRGNPEALGVKREREELLLPYS